jgi:hypothetical protein
MPTGQWRFYVLAAGGKTEATSGSFQQFAHVPDMIADSGSHHGSCAN